jgi:hypothetical protein
MIILLFLFLFGYVFGAIKIMDFVLNRTKTQAGHLLALACGLFPLVIIVQLIVSFGIVQ